MRARFAAQRADNSLSKNERAEEVHDDGILAEADIEDIRRENFRGDTLDDGIEGVSHFRNGRTCFQTNTPFVSKDVNEIRWEIVQILSLNNEE